MINTGNVSLRQAREDCGISGSGGLKNVTEFIDRHGSSGYSLKDLGGHVLAFSSKAVTGSYRSNSNPGALCRKNYAEQNVYSVRSSHNANLTQPGNLWSETWTGDASYISMAGWSFVGTIPSGTKTYKYRYACRGRSTGSSMSIELIGWRGGYFVGTPTYYANFQTSHEQNTPWMNVEMDGTATPYITLCIQALGNNYVSNIEVFRAGLKQ